MDAERIARLVDRLRETESKKEQALARGREFTDLLFHAIPELLAELRTRHENVGQVIERSRDDGMREWSFKWGEDKLTFLLYDNVASAYKYANSGF